MNRFKTAFASPVTRVGIYSLLVNTGLTSAKLVLSVLTGSLALRADAFHSLVDVVASIALIIGVMISGRKTRGFPYGLYKVENLVSAIISLLLFVTAYTIIVEAISQTDTGAYEPWVLGTVALLILVPFFFSRYELAAGRKYNSPALIADGSQFRADIAASLIVFAAVAGQLAGLPLDKVAAIAVAAFIVYAAWRLLVGSMKVLLDASVSSEIISRIRSIIEKEPAVGDVREISGRNSGRFIFIEAVVTIRTDNFRKAHMVSQRLEDSIKQAITNVDRVLIHFEPDEKSWSRYAFALSNRQGEVSGDFGKSAYFAIADLDKKSQSITRQEMIANPYSGNKKGRGIKLAELLLGYKPDKVVSGDEIEGKGPGYVFKNAGVQFEKTDSKTIDSFLETIRA